MATATETTVVTAAEATVATTAAKATAAETTVATTAAKATAAETTATAHVVAKAMEAGSVSKNKKSRKNESLILKEIQQSGSLPNRVKRKLSSNNENDSPNQSNIAIAKKKYQRVPTLFGKVSVFKLINKAFL